MIGTPLRCRRSSALRINYAVRGFDGETVRMSVSIPTGTVESRNWFEGVLGILLHAKRAHDDKLRGWGPARTPTPTPGPDDVDWHTWPDDHP